MANRYWFARRFPVDEPGNRMDPVTREGWWVVGGFIAALVLGAIGFAVAAFGFRQPLFGFIVLMVCASFGMTAFLMLAVQRGDKRHTVEDYRRGRVSQ